MLLRHLARWYLFSSWKRSLSRGDRVRLWYWGATGNADHHPYIWADFPTLREERAEKRKTKRHARSS